MGIIIGITAVYIALVVFTGIYFTRKSRTVSDFVLGGMTLGPWITAFAYGTSYFSAVVFVGFAGRFGWAYGLSVVWIGLANAFIGSLAAWAVLGRRTRVMTQYFGSATMPDFFEKRYMSKAIKTVSAVIVFVFLIPYTASIYNGLSRLFATAFGTGDDSYAYFVIGIAAVTAVYVILGGYKATAYNNLFQGVIMLVGIVAVIMATLNLKGGFTSAVAELSQVENTTGAFAGMNGAFTSFFGPDPINLLGVMILTSLGTWGLPQMVHKFYTIKDERSIKAGTVISTVFAVIIAGGCYFLGAFGRIFWTGDAPSGGAFDEIIPAMMEQLPVILLGIVVVLVLSASMSSLAGLVLSSSSTLTIDMIKPMFKDKIDEKKSVLIMRVFIGVFIFISVLIALNRNALISDLMGYSWGALSGAFLAPFMYGLFWKKTTKASVWVSFILASAASVLHLIFKPAWVIGGFNLASPVNFGAVLMVVSLIIVPAVSLVTAKPDKAQVDEMFKCLEHLKI
ncbi:MAG: sodium:solute symporter [Oscillospiraceae bacterium]|nr:sodium:solute symporter [Oscillospiraceae bacterium]